MKAKELLELIEAVMSVDDALALLGLFRSDLGESISRKMCSSHE